MKKIVFVLMIMFTTILCGCSLPFEIPFFNETSTQESSDEAAVPIVAGEFSFTYKRQDDAYVLLMGIYENNGKNPIAGGINANIRIVNEKDEVVYNETPFLKEEEFTIDTSFTGQKLYYIRINIPAADIKQSDTTKGKVYFNVVDGNNSSYFDKLFFETDKLPLKKAQIEVKQQLPLEINVMGLNGSVASKINIENVTYVFEEGAFPKLKVTVVGTKTYSNGTMLFDKIKYKICDSDGYVVKTGDILLNSLDAGDKFKDESIFVQNALPGGHYTLSLGE